MCGCRPENATVARRSNGQQQLTPSPTSIPSGSRGQTPSPPPGNQWAQCGGKNEVETGSRFARDLRAPRTGFSSPEERTRALQNRLFATPRPDPAAMDAGAAGPPIDQTRKPRDEPVTFLHVNCPNFSDAARKESKAAWRHLLLALSPEGSTLRPLDILLVYYECHLSGDFPPGCSTFTLPRGIAAVSNGKHVKEEFPPTRRGLLEQLLLGISTGHPAGMSLHSASLVGFAHLLPLP